MLLLKTYGALCVAELYLNSRYSMYLVFATELTILYLVLLTAYCCAAALLAALLHRCRCGARDIEVQPVRRARGHVEHRSHHLYSPRGLPAIPR